MDRNWYQSTRKYCSTVWAVGILFKIFMLIIVVIMWERIGEEMLMLFSIALNNLQKRGISANKSLAICIAYSASRYFPYLISFNQLVLNGFSARPIYAAQYNLC